MPCAALACTVYWTAGGYIVESDVHFDSGHDWATTDDKVESKAYDATEGRPILNTALHELGPARRSRMSPECSSPPRRPPIPSSTSRPTT